VRERGFISYISEEEAVAEYVKDRLAHAFGSDFDLFVSSLDLRPGNWLDQLREQLAQASLIFPLLSDASKYRPWISFEAGCVFIARDVDLIPVLHRGMTRNDLVAPFSFFQSYDLTQPNSVRSLIASLSERTARPPPEIDFNGFTHEIFRLDRELSSLFSTFGELAEQEPLKTQLEGKPLRPATVSIDRLENWDELQLRTHVHKDVWVEASGYTDQAMGFNLYDIPMPEGANWLVVETSKTQDSRSADMDKLLKININRETVPTAIRGHQHYNDREFSIKGDGLFAYEIPPTALINQRIDSVSVAFWKIELRRILLRFHLA
jgi:TIR domain